MNLKRSLSWYVFGLKCLTVLVGYAMPIALMQSVDFLLTKMLIQRPIMVQNNLQQDASSLTNTPSPNRMVDETPQPRSEGRLIQRGGTGVGGRRFRLISRQPGPLLAALREQRYRGLINWILVLCFIVSFAAYFPLTILAANCVKEFKKRASHLSQDIA